MRWLWRIVRIGLIAYLGVILVLLWLENRLVYVPKTAAEFWQPPPSPEVQDVWLPLADGITVHGWWYPKPGTKGALLYFHGNFGNLSQRGGAIAKFRERLNVGVFIVDYPGYGKSEGSPTEAGCYAAAHAAYAWLTDPQKGSIAPEDLLIYGGSVGGAVAIELASQKPHRALILAKTFTSMPEVAQSVYPFVPVRLLMRNRFPSLERLPSCKQPIFIAHGDADTFVPFGQGERLFAAANEPKHFCTLPGDDHNDPLPERFFAELIPFLQESQPAR